MVKYILERVEGIDWMAIIPLLCFFIFFVAIVIYVLAQKKNYLDKMSNMPLEDSLKNQQET